MKIVIIGPPKSGTTGLFFKIRNSLAGPCRELFEQPGYQRSAADESRNVIAKALLGTPTPLDAGSFDSFEIKIGLIRDPRDWMISSLLYGIFDAPFCEDPEATDAILELVRRKEEAPRSVSLLSLINLMRSLMDRAGRPRSKAGASFLSLPMSKEIAEHYRGRFQLFADFFRQHPAYFVFKYEDFVREEFAGLEKHLGFSLAGRDGVATRFQRVVRTKGAGDWRNWLVKEDVEFFRPVFAPFMSEFGYPDDWELAPSPVIAPEHASIYIRGLVAERKAITLSTTQANADELIAEAKRVFKKFSRTFSTLEPGRRESEKEMDELYMILHWLARRLEQTPELQQLDQTRKQLKEVSANLRESRAECLAFRKSLAWKITSPLRSMRRMFLGATHLLLLYATTSGLVDFLTGDDSVLSLDDALDWL